MILSDFVTHVNDVSDESESIQTVTRFVNDAIAKINAECKANYPFMSPSDAAIEFALPDTWVYTILVPFTAGRIKTKDSSQFEYTDLYSEAMEGLINFKANYIIPDEYKDPASNSMYSSDIYTSRPFGWMGW